MKKVTFQGNALTLIGRTISVSQPAPRFQAVTTELKQTNLSDFENRIKVITSFPSIDTPVCDLQVKEFNKKSADLGDEVVVVAISKDLPFAQKRFCEAFDIHSLILLSDYQSASYGFNYGLLIRELNLLARAIFVLDAQNVVRYVQIVDELTHTPNYEEALKAVKDVVANPAVDQARASDNWCVVCEGRGSALGADEIAEKLAAVKGWECVENKKINKKFAFKTYAEARCFVDAIAAIAESEGHHPIMTLSYNAVKVSLSTHAAGGLTNNDFIMAAIIDGIA